MTPKRFPMCSLQCAGDPGAGGGLRWPLRLRGGQPRPAHLGRAPGVDSLHLHTSPRYLLSLCIIYELI